MMALLPEGYACANLLLDDAGNPSDWEYQLINPAFASLQEKEEGDFIGQRASGIDHLVLENPAQLAASHGPALLRHEEVVFETHSEARGQWFSVRMVPLEGVEFGIFLLDITVRREIDLQLKASEARYKQLVLTAPNPIIVTQDKEVILVNTEACRLMGASDPQQLVGLSLQEFVHPNYLESTANRLRQFYAGDESVYPAHSVYLTLDKTPFDVEILASKIVLEGKPAIQFSLANITSRILTEQTIRDREEQLSAIFNNTIQCEILFEVIGSRLIAVNVNDSNIAFFHNLGLPAKKSDFLAKTPEEILVSVLKLNQQDVDTANSWLNEVLHTGVPTTREITKYLLGKKVTTEIRVIPVFSGRENAKYVLWSALDITSKSLAEQEIKDLEAGFSKAYHLATIGTWRYLIAENTFIWSDHAIQVMGFSPENTPKSWEEFMGSIHPDDVQSLLKSFEEGTLALSYDVTLRMIHQPEIRWIRFVSQTYQHEKRPYAYSSGILQDITPQKVSELTIKSLNQDLEKKVKERTQQLSQSNKDLEAFAYTVSHDLRAPIRHIMGFANLLDRYVPQGEEKAQEYLANIMTAGKRMENLVTDILEYSRLRIQALELQELDLNYIIGILIEQAQPDIGDRDIRWILPPLPHVRADRAMIRIVFDNLINNAIKFTSTVSQAVIEIGYEKEKNGTTFFIRDNGVGFEQEYADKIFNAFERLHAEDKFPGTGIGMANIKRIVERHGGKVSAQGVVGKGATVSFYLPD
ncbi:MAG: ATP-binding protein [Bacteroidia bacterium]|nr:ATP-binding protein [Bacteroidia bacterium]